MGDASGISGLEISAELLPATEGDGVAVARLCRRWSDDELSQLWRCIELGLPDEEIATELNRSHRAVRTMILRLKGRLIRSATLAWTDEECQLALAMQAKGASCAEIAAALPSRTELAVFRKLRLLVGAAPFAESRRSRHSAAAANPASVAAAVESAPPPEPVTAFAPARPVAANESGRPPWIAQPAPPACVEPILATVDTMVRWLRSRDFMVLRKAASWQVDQHHLHSDIALTEFVNVRRARLRMPPFSLSSPERVERAFGIAG